MQVSAISEIQDELPARQVTLMVGDGISELADGDWQPIETAPRDGRPFQARIPDHGEDNIIAWMDGLLNEDGEDCGGWYFAEDQDPPECWTDGICWESNADGYKSVEPTHWKPLVASAETEGGADG